VVEKCNFCAERLVKGEMPACVDACKAAGVGAISFGDITDPTSEVAALIRDNDTLRRKVFLGTKPHVFYLV
jgi:molybdopterin-containing oxidoreductase family iron-sulfur binding subunit